MGRHWECGSTHGAGNKERLGSLNTATSVGVVERGWLVRSWYGRDDGCVRPCCAHALRHLLPAACCLLPAGSPEGQAHPVHDGGGGGEDAQGHGHTRVAAHVACGGKKAMPELAHSPCKWWCSAPAGTRPAALKIPSSATIITLTHIRQTACCLR